MSVWTEKRLKERPRSKLKRRLPIRQQKRRKSVDLPRKRQS